MLICVKTPIWRTSKRNSAYKHDIFGLKLQLVLERLFCKDGIIDETMRTSLLNYVNIVISSSFELFESSDDIIKHEMIIHNSGIAVQIDHQTIRDSQ